jgi:hypothetical protein
MTGVGYANRYIPELLSGLLADWGIEKLVEYEDDIDEGMGHKGGRSPTQQSSPWHHSGKTSE